MTDAALAPQFTRGEHAFWTCVQNATGETAERPRYVDAFGGDLDVCCERFECVRAPD